MKITFISDTHTARPQLPGGDILIHAGDMTYNGRTKETKAQLNWMNRSGYKHIVIVPGNHEVDWEEGHVPYERYCKERDIICLIDESIEIEGIKIWGSPRTPEFCGWAYMHDRLEIQRYWNKIPEDTNILITHGPPMGILDMNTQGGYCGCPSLRETVKRIKPKIHVFGHIHESHGHEEDDDTLYINAAIMDRHYQPVHHPTNVEWIDKDTVIIEQSLGEK